MEHEEGESCFHQPFLVVFELKWVHCFKACHEMAALSLRPLLESVSVCVDDKYGRLNTVFMSYQRKQRLGP